MQGHSVGLGMSAWMALIWLTSLPFSLGAQQVGGQPPPKRERHAVHLMDALNPDVTELNEALEGAVTSLKAGYEVAILFDSKSVTSLRMNQKKKTVLEEIDISDRERQALGERLGVSQSEVPRNYLEYVQHLVKTGAQVFVNQNALRLYGLSQEEIHPIAVAISTRKMAEILDEAELCYNYGGR